MIRSNRRRLGGMALAGVFVTTGASAQPIARSFEDLPRTLKVGQTVFVTDATGRQTKGKIANLSASTLVVLTPETRTFADGAVTEIRTVDPLWNGALIGVGVGIGLAIWDYLIDPSEPGNAAIFTAGIGLGAAIGSGIDALVRRPGKTVYLARRVRVSPLLGHARQGVRLSVRF